MAKMYATSTLPGERFVIGPFGDVGYIAKRPGYGAPVEKMLEVRSDKRLLDVFAAERRRDLKREAYLNNYYRKFDELSIRASVNRMAELGMREADEYFRCKQNKLRRLLLEEQSKFVEEYTTKAQNATDNMLAKEKLKAEEIAKKKSNTDELKAQQIYLEMAMKKSDEYRQKLLMANIKHLSDSYKEQIREKEDLKRAEQQENEAFEAKREEEYKEAKLEEYRKMCKTAQEKSEMLKFLSKQVEDKQLIRRRHACIDEVNEERNNEIRKVWEDALHRREEEAERRQKLNVEALSRQIQANRLLAEQHRQDELQLEKIMTEDKARKAERESATSKFNKLEPWNELAVFKESVVQYRKAIAAAEDVAERNTEEHRKIFERNRWKVKRDAAKGCRDLRAECVATSKRMAEDKKTKQEELKTLDSKYGELVKVAGSIHNELDEELHRRKAVDRIAFNKAQTRYLTTLKIRQELEDEEMLNKMRSSSEENLRKVKASLERPMTEIAGTAIHPFYRASADHS